MIPSATATATATAPANRSSPPRATPSWRRRLAVPWRSPQDQPAWTRPVLLSLAAAAAVLYGWGLNGRGLHPYYAPAVKSMSVSWRAFFYGGYDPAASITLDKLPGAFMVQALSARVFGFHTWSILLPQVAATVATILLLYRVVNRWLGPVAGMFAATAYATMPVAAALAHNEISDTILVLLLMLAADAWQRAVATARLRTLLLCGVWVGLAFQTKMVQAWGVLPAFALGYLLAAPAGWRRRLAHVGLAGLVTVAVSMWWILLIYLTPASSRPYVDGTTDNSPVAMVFGRNLLDRFGIGDGSGPQLPSEPAGFGYLLGDGTAPQVGWLYPLALVGLIVGVWWRGRAPRTDPVRAGYLMWGLWLVVHGLAFTTGSVEHVFYLVAMAPAITALAAGGLVTLWSAYRDPGWRRWLLPTTVAATVAWTVYVSQRFPSFLPWTTPVVVVAGTAAVLVLVVTMMRPALRRWAPVGAALVVAAVLTVPAAWAVSTVDDRFDGTAIGPSAGVSTDFSVPSRRPGGGPGPLLLPRPDGGSGASAPPGQAPGEPGPGPGGSGPGHPGLVILPGGPGGPIRDMADHPSARAEALLRYLAGQRHGEKYLVAAQGSELAGELLLAGVSVLPMGGFAGVTPFPTAGRLAGMVAQGQVRFVLLRAVPPAPPGALGIGPRPVTGPVSDWVTGHCAVVDAAAYGGGKASDETLYDCPRR